jgi:hypothetical protein
MSRVLHFSNATPFAGRSATNRTHPGSITSPLSGIDSTLCRVDEIFWFVYPG